MDSKVKEEIARAVESMKDEMVDTLQQLVRIPSIAGNEGETQKFILKQFENFGLEIHSFEADRSKIQHHPAYNENYLPYEGRPNIIGILRGNPQKKSMILNGHVDTASPEPIDAWKHDPWGAEIEENRLYGNGALDMKAGCIANLYSLKALNKIGLKPEGTVMLQSVIEEEAGGGGGTLACFVEGYTGDGMIITEPLPYICVARAGLVYFRIKVKGMTAHGGRAHLGINAIGKTLKIYQALEQLDEERAVTVRFPLFEMGWGRSCNVSISRLNAGSWIPSTIAGAAEMEGRISFVPGEKREEIRKTLEATVHKVAEHDPWLREHPPVVEYFSFQTDPEYYDPSNPFVKMISSSAETMMGEKVEVLGRPAAADTRFSQYFGFPSVTFGPSGDNPHGADEYVNLDSLEMVTKVIALATLKWCSLDKKQLT